MSKVRSEFWAALRYKQRRMHGSGYLLEILGPSATKNWPETVTFRYLSGPAVGNIMYDFATEDLIACSEALAELEG